MEVYILDDLLRRTDVVDDFDSLIWKEGYSSYGDFELVLHSTLKNRNRFKTGTNLAMNESHRVMIVDTIEDSTDDEGRKLLKIKGPSLEKILEDRIARGTLGGTNTEEKWVLTGTPGNIVRKIFHDICVIGTLNVGDVIPFVIEGNVLFPDDTIEESSEIITVEIEPTTVYVAIKNICDQFDLGFRLVRNYDSSQLYWDVYSGSDRTTLQSDLPPIIFSPELENLTNTTELTTTAVVKNVAHVICPVGHVMVYATDVDSSIAGFNRRVMLVKADDITDEDAPTALAKMIRRGREELSKNRSYSAFDGEISQNSKYKYGVNYNLGDLVEVRIVTGVTNNMRITEQIFVSDKEGDRSYPTLTVSTGFITPGVWSAWDSNQEWEDVEANQFWSNQI